MCVLVSIDILKTQVLKSVFLVSCCVILHCQFSTNAMCVCVCGDNRLLKKSLRLLTAFLKLSESHTDACIPFSDYKRHEDALFMPQLPRVNSALLWKL